MKLDGSPDEIIHIAHTWESTAELTARGLVIVKGRIQIALALQRLGIYVLSRSREGRANVSADLIFTTPEGLDVGDFIRRCARKLNMTATQLGSYFVGRPERLAAMRAMWNLDASRDDLQGFLDATPGGKLIKELRSQGL